MQLSSCSLFFFPLRLTLAHRALAFPILNRSYLPLDSSLKEGLLMTFVSRCTYKIIATFEQTSSLV